MPVRLCVCMYTRAREDLKISVLSNWENGSGRRKQWEAKKTGSNSG
nr:MAG TPA: hypothetical protein [Caudoviricetes sp.]